MTSVMVIEDNAVNLVLFTDLLECGGYEVIGCDSAEIGLQEAEERIPDLILMDIALPGLDGLTAIRLLKSNVNTSRIPVAVLSAHAMACDERSAWEAGCVKYLTKPIDTRTFLATIAELISSARVKL